ncbi:GH116 family glycosyl-hydrolase, partial [Bacteroidota bacterium]
MKKHKPLYPLCIVLMLVTLTMCTSDDIPSTMTPFTQDLDMDIDEVMQRLKLDSKGLTPTVKEFDRDWVESLFTRGEPSVYGAEGFDYIGMPIGGITSGQLYLGGDGKLWHWDIFNTRHKSLRAPRYANPPKQFSPVEQGFSIRTTVDGKSQVRTLDRHGFSDVSFLGQYPIGYVTYKDADAPVTVKLEAFSPFIPLNIDDSSFPATVMQYTIKNVSDQPIEAALGGWLENSCTESSAINHPGERSNHIESCSEISKCCPDVDSCNSSKQTSDSTDLQAAAREPSNSIENGPGAMFLKMISQPPPPIPDPGTLRPDIVFEDFESGTYNNWTIEGEVFGQPGDSLVPVSRKRRGGGLSGYQGDYLADAY